MGIDQVISDDLNMRVQMQHEEALKIAKTMLGEREPVEWVARMTCIDQREIEQLRSQEIREWYDSHEWYDVRVWDDVGAWNEKELVAELRKIPIYEARYEKSYMSYEKALRDELSFRYELGERSARERIRQTRSKQIGKQMMAIQVLLSLRKRLPMSIDELMEITELERELIESINDRFPVRRELSLSPLGKAAEQRNRVIRYLLREGKSADEVAELSGMTMSDVSEIAVEQSVDDIENTEQQSP